MNRFKIEIEFADLTSPEALKFFQTLANMQGCAVSANNTEPEKAPAKPEKAEIPKETAAQKKARLAAKAEAEFLGGKESEEDNDNGNNEADEAPTVDEIRALLSKVVGENRDAIKAKLSELGAANVTTLSEDNYIEFYAFLKGLAPF